MVLSAGIIGAGKLGTALIKEFKSKGISCFAVSGSEKRTAELHKIAGSDLKIFTNSRDINIFPAILFLTVPDSKIKYCAAELAEYFPKELSNTRIVHCSGFLNIDELSQLEKISKSTAALHPYQTFHSPHENVFENVGWLCRCENKDKTFFSELINILNGKITFADEIPRFEGEKYHISAVFASNYLSAILQYSTKMAEKSGINPSEFIPKIAETTLLNAFPEYNYKAEFALTGPIARGDLNAVSKHIKSLQNNPIELKGYILTGLATTELAFVEKIINAEEFEILKKLFLCEIKTIYSI